jgi:diguanylate cyclase (GGDEF)-like protein
MMLNDELQNINFTDYLTQIPNRRKFFYDVYQFVKEQDYLLIMMDFNNFKTINDVYGHNTGDELLCVFSSKMQTILDDSEGVLYRLGGDEFAILSPMKKQFNVDEIMHELDQLLHQYHDSISLSYGSILLTKDNCNSNRKVETHMHIADKKMYHMKQAFYEKRGIHKGGKAK